MSNTYDDIRYPTGPQAQTHPFRLAALAASMGLAAAPFAECRMLEIGCGDGGNLVGMALSAPGASFVGIDLAQAPILHGQFVARELGLTNLRLEARDLCAPNEDLGQFDYVIAHGVYAWVPANVREALMALVGRALAPHGLAYVSYNALPGCRVREIIRDLLLSQPGIASGDFASRVAVARGALGDFIDRWSKTAPLQQALADEARLMLKRPDEVLFHDELGEVYEPQYLTDVVHAAAKHGLSYVCDSAPRFDEGGFDVGDPGSEPKESEAVRLEVEQVQDFIRMRRFRQSIFRRTADSSAPAYADWTALRGLWACADPTNGPAALGDRDGAIFLRPAEDEPDANHPQLNRLLDAMTDAYPKAISLEPFITDATVGEMTLRLAREHILDLLTEPFEFVTKASPRPMASALARWQAAHGVIVISLLCHMPLRINSPETLRLLPLLDGQRDRLQLAREVYGQASTATLTKLEGQLRNLAAAALLSA